MPFCSMNVCAKCEHAKFRRQGSIMTLRCEAIGIPFTSTDLMLGFFCGQRPHNFQYSKTYIPKECLYQLEHSISTDLMNKATKTLLLEKFQSMPERTHDDWEFYCS